MVRFLFLLLCVLGSGAALAEDVLTGFSARSLEFRGPGEWRQSAEPIWVYEYHALRLRYRASGLPAKPAQGAGRPPASAPALVPAHDARPVLTLRPGSVGPVTPGATNRENPFAAGMPVVVLRAEDLENTEAAKTITVELRGKTRTAQVDQLQFSLPAGASLVVEELEFRADPQALPCAAGAVALPAGAQALAVSGPMACGGAPATSLRGRESLRIDAGGRAGSALYLTLLAHFAGVSGFSVDGPLDRWRVKESHETAHVVARIRYGDGGTEEQFPLLVSERRHALLNRVPALYALELDPRRPVVAVEIEDRSPHAQLVLFAAGVSQQAPPPAEEELPPQLTKLAAASGPPGLEGSRWFRIEGASPSAFHPHLRVVRERRRIRLSLDLTNTEKSPLEFNLYFPSVQVRPSSDPGDVHYLFPRQGVVLSRREGKLENDYSGAFPLQFLDVFAPRANRGACLLVEDTEGRAKSFRLEKRGAVVHMVVQQKVRLAPGETYHAPEAVVEFHNGDWRQGFAAYRAWLKTWYKPAGPRPEWLGSAFFCRRDYPVGGSGRLFDVRANRYTFEDLLRDGEAFGGVDFIDISGWALSDKVGRVGDYPIELGGAGDLRKNMAWARERGVPTGLYFEGYLIDKNSEVGRRWGAAWQMVDAKGGPRWWPGGSPEMFVCPHVPAWREYLAGRIAAVAAEAGAAAVYIDEQGFADPGKNCFATSHGHPPGVGPLQGEIALAREVRRALDAAGQRAVMMYLEENPPDTLAPYYDAAFSYALPRADATLSPLKLNLFRFAFPDVRLWDMLSIGIHPRALSPEDFRLSLWHGNGVWLKGHSDTWYGEDLLAFLQRARQILRRHRAAFGGEAEPLVASPHPAVFIHRFTGGGETVYTLWNASFRTVRFSFLGRERTLGPRDVDVVGI